VIEKRDVLFNESDNVSRQANAEMVVSDWQLGESQNESTISTGRVNAESRGS